MNMWGFDRVGADPELILDSMRKLALLVTEFPQPVRLGESRGAGGATAGRFRRELSELASDLRSAGESLLTEMDEIEQAVRAAAHQLAETDAAAAEIANLLLAQLEAAPEAQSATVSLASIPAQNGDAAPSRTVG